MLTISPQLLHHFKGFCSSPSVIMLFVYMKCRFSLSYRDLEEMMMIRGAKIDHATLQRWLKRFVSLIDKRVRQRKKPVNGSWRMDETYIKLNGKWIYLYRAVDKEGNTIDFLLRAKRDAVAAKAFFRKAFKENGRPDKVTVDKSGSNKAALDYFNKNVLSVRTVFEGCFVSIIDGFCKPFHLRWNDVFRSTVWKIRTTAPV